MATSLLHALPFCSDLNIESVVSALVDRGHNVEVFDKHHRTPLHAAILARNQHAIEVFLKYGADLSTTDHRSRNPLHLSLKHSSKSLLSPQDVQEIREKRQDIALFVIERTEALPSPPNFNAQIPESLLAPLHQACFEGFDRVVTKLIELGADIEARDRDGNTPLFLAIRKNHTAVVRSLLARNASFFVKNRRHLTPLQVALSSVSPLSALTDQDDLSPEKSWEVEQKKKARQAIALMLLETYEKCRQVDDLSYVNDTSPQSLLTPLHQACYEGYAQVVTKLLELQTDIEARDRDGNTPLFLAIRKNHTAVVRSLLARNASIFVKNRRHLTPLQVALSSVSPLSALTDQDDLSPEKSFEIEQNKKELQVIALMLLETYEKCRKTDDSSYINNPSPQSLLTPLHQACFEGYDGVVLKLIELGANIEARDRDGDTPLHIAALKGFISIAKVLVEALMKIPESLGQLNDKRRFPLHEALRSGRSPDLSRFLLDSMRSDPKLSAQISNPDSLGMSCLLYSLLIPNPDVFEDLFGPDSINQISSKMDSPLHLACLGGHPELIRRLLLTQTPPNPKNAKGLSPLHLLMIQASKKVSSGKNDEIEECALLLIEKTREMSGSFSFLKERLEDGSSLLCLASHAGFDKVVSKLLLSDDQINVPDKDGDTPLSLAISNNHKVVVGQLLKAGANIFLKNRRFASTLHVALSSPFSFLALLNKKKLDPHESESRQDIAIMLLESYEKNMGDAGFGYINDSLPQSLMTPLHQACCEGYDRVVQKLIELGAEIEAQEQDGDTPLFVAIVKNQKPIIDLLLQKGANVLHKNRRSITSLHVSLSSFFNLAPLLKQKFRGMITSDREERKEQREEIALLLINRYVAIHKHEELFAQTAALSSFTPLHQACCEGYVRVVQRLLELGAPIDILDKHRATSLQTAVRRYHKSSLTDQKSRYIVNLLAKCTYDSLNTTIPSLFDLSTWLRSISSSLVAHAETFRCHGFDDLQAIRTLTDQDLQDILEIDAIGHRRLLLRAIEKLRNP